MDTKELDIVRLQVPGLELYERPIEREELSQLSAFVDREGWNSSLEDIHLMYDVFPGDMRGAFDCQGQLIGCCINFAQNDELSYIGFYIVSPDFRGKGIGKVIFDRATRKTTPGRCTIVLDAVFGTKSMYLKEGFISGDVIKQAASGVLQVSDDVRSGVLMQPDDVTVTPISEELIDEVLIFDSQICPISGSRRHEFRRRWILHPNSITRCAIRDYKVVAYLVIRKPLKSTSRHFISCFYADDVTVARRVLYDITDELPRGQRLLGYFPTLNKEADDLLAEVGLTERDTKNSVEFMYKGQPAPPLMPWNNVFCVTDNTTSHV